MLKERNSYTVAANGPKDGALNDDRKSANGGHRSAGARSNFTQMKRPHDHGSDDDDVVLNLEDMDDDDLGDDDDIDEDDVDEEEDEDEDDDDLDDDDDEDEEEDDEKIECAKAMRSHKSDKASRNDISIDVDEPNDDLYVNSEATDQSNRSDAKSSKVKQPDDGSESASNNGPTTRGDMVNGGSDSAATQPSDKSSDDQAKSAPVKSHKRKLSISSDDEEMPPSKAYVDIVVVWPIFDLDEQKIGVLHV